MVFFHPKADGPGHVGMYVGDGKFVHAPRTGDVVKVSAARRLRQRLHGRRPAVLTLKPARRGADGKEYVTDVVSAQLQVTAQRVEAIRQLLEDPTAATAASSRRDLREHELRPHAGADARHGRAWPSRPRPPCRPAAVGCLVGRADRRRRRGHAAAGRGDPARLRPRAAELADRRRRRARRRPGAGASRRCRSSAPPSVVPPPSPQAAARVALALRELGVAEDPPGSNDSAAHRRVPHRHRPRRRRPVVRVLHVVDRRAGRHAARRRRPGRGLRARRWPTGCAAAAATSRRARARRARATSSSSTGSATASSTTSASCESVTADGRVHTIEGNADGAVRQRDYAASQIAGYGLLP